MWATSIGSVASLARSPSTATASGAISFAPPAQPKSPISAGVGRSGNGTAAAAAARCPSAAVAAARWGRELWL